MTSSPWLAEMSTSAQAKRAYRSRSLSNLLKMGHCAPAVARTIAEATGGDGEWLVRAAAGLPGGVGNTGGECGGVTAALLLLGLRYGGAVEKGLPVVVEKGHAYCARFQACHGALRCKELLGDRRLPLPCVKVIRTAPEQLAETIQGEADLALPLPARSAYVRLASHLAERGFHCAHAVFHRLGHALPVNPELFDATYGFIGGTVFKGLTCSALAAGVMAIGLGAGTIESSRVRVVRMLATMLLGGDAMADGLNEFNKSVNRGNRLASWFAGQFGSTQCRALTGCDFSLEVDVQRYIAGGQIAHCEAMAGMVASQAEAILAGAGAPPA